MAFTNFEFPHSSYYNSDLQELLRMYKQLSEEYTGIKDSITECLKQIENFGDYVDEEIQKGLTVAIANIDSRMSAIEKKFESTYTDLIKMKNDVSSMGTNLYKDIESLRNVMTKSLIDIRFDMNAMITLFSQYKEDTNRFIQSQIDSLVECIMDYLEELERLSVTNPFTGERVDIQIVLNEIAEYLISGYGLTAKEYDDMKITASQYDNLMISAMNYSMRGFFMFFEHFYMKIRSPFTGKLETYTEIIDRLVDYHKEALMAEEYDDKRLQAAEYDNLQIISRNYDWHGAVII